MSLHVLILAVVLTAMVVIAVVTTQQAAFELVGGLYAYRDDASQDEVRYPPDPAKTSYRFALLVPARNEAEVLPYTLETLAEQTHGHVLIVPVIYHDDVLTMAAARRAEALFPSRIRVLEFDPGDGPRNKPRKLNAALWWLRDTLPDSELDETIVGVFDAEDYVVPGLLRRIDAAFAEDSTTSVVQGGVQLMNHDSSWFSVHNVLEYFGWFSSRMAFNARLGFVPLGGNTVFARFRLLEQVGGWPETLTEDCSLGVLLTARHGAKVRAYYEAGFSTQEQTPHTLRDLFRQRVRWIQGFFVEFKRGVWRDLPQRRQRAVAVYVLTLPFYQGFSALYVGVSVLSFFLLSAPVGLALVMYLPILPMFLQLLLKVVQLHDFGREYAVRVKARTYLALLVFYWPYQMVLATAGLVAIVREFRGDRSWHKTSHAAAFHAGRHVEPLEAAVNV